MDCIIFLQEVGSRASVYGLQQFLSLCCMLLDDIIALVNRGLIINGIDLTAVNITPALRWTCRRYSSALECILESSLLDAYSDLLLSKLKLLVLDGAKDSYSL